MSRKHCILIVDDDRAAADAAYTALSADSRLQVMAAYGQEMALSMAEWSKPGTLIVGKGVRQVVEAILALAPGCQVLLADEVLDVVAAVSALLPACCC